MWYDECLEKPESQQNYETFIRQQRWTNLDELTGKVLGCWCDPQNSSCHGHILIRLWREKHPDFIVNETLGQTKFYEKGITLAPVTGKKRPRNNTDETKEDTKSVVVTSPLVATSPPVDISPPVKKSRKSTQPVKKDKKPPKGPKIRNQTTHPQGFKNYIWPILDHEWNPNTLWIDETGMGCWSGPMYVCATYLLPGFDIQGLHDSKLLSVHEREHAYRNLTSSDKILYEIEKVSNVEIDQLKLGNAWKEGIRRVIIKLRAKILAYNPQLQITRVVLDGNKTVPNTLIPITTVISADRLYAGVSAASILAKVSRDEYMKSVAPNYPEFAEIFAKGHGYRYSAHHTDLIKAGKYTDLHRKSFNPLREKLNPKIHVETSREKSSPNSPIKVLTWSPDQPTTEDEQQQEEEHI
jgi:ribonuclease HII